MTSTSATTPDDSSNDPATVRDDAAFGAAIARATLSLLDGNAVDAGDTSGLSRRSVARVTHTLDAIRSARRERTVSESEK